MKFIATLQKKSFSNFKIKKNSFLKKEISKSKLKSKIKIEKIRSLNRKLHFNFFLKNDNKQYSHSTIDNFEIIVIGFPHKNGKIASCQDILNMFYQNKKKLFFLSGNWIIQIYDNFTNKMYIFRDYLGAKPFYYSTHKDQVYISSNIGLFLENNFSNRNLNHNFVNLYLNSHPKCVFGRSETIFSDIVSFPPNYYLEINSNLSINRVKFYDKKDFLLKNFKRNISNNSFEKNIETIIRNSTTKKKYKKIACSSSGGIDSAVVLHSMNKIFQRKVDTFTLAFDDKYNYDETKSSKLLAAKFTNRHNIINIKFKNLVKDLGNIYDYLDVPVCTASFYGFYYLYKIISQKKYDAIVTGFGGNNINSGFYPSFLFNFLDIKKKNELQKEIKQWIKIHNTKQNPKSLKIFQKFVNSHYDKNVPGKILDKIFYLNNKNVFLKKVKKRKIRRNNDLINFGNYLNSYHYYALINDSVAQSVDIEDSIEWLNDVEIISPLIDKSLISYGFSLNRLKKINNGINRIEIRNRYKGKIPKQILENIHTEGFKLPINMWMRKELKNYLLKIINSTQFRKIGIFNIKNIKIIFKEHFDKKNDNSMNIWSIINFYFWFLKWKPKI